MKFTILIFSLLCVLSCTGGNVSAAPPAPPTSAPINKVTLTVEDSPATSRSLTAGKPLIERANLSRPLAVTSDPPRLVVSDDSKTLVIDTTTGVVVGEMDTTSTKWSVHKPSGILVHHGGSRDTPVSLETGKLINLGAELPDGTVTNVGIRLVASPANEKIWAFIEYRGSAMAGLWNPATDGRVVKTPHKVPFVADTLAGSDAHALALNLQMFLDNATGCSLLTLPVAGPPSCVDLGAALNEIVFLTEGWVSINPEGGKPYVMHYPSKTRISPNGESPCPNPVVIAGIASPPRLLLGCPNEASTAMFLWSPETIWTWEEAFLIDAGLAPPSPLRGIDSSSQHALWVQLVTGTRIETPPLDFDGFGTGAPPASLVARAISVVEGAPPTLLRFDSTSAKLTAIDTVDDCPGDLRFSVEEDVVVITCLGEKLLWSEVHQGNKEVLRTPLNVAAVRDDLVVLTDDLSGYLFGKASRMWVVKR